MLLQTLRIYSAVGPHSCGGILMNCSDDGNELVGQAEGMLQDMPKSFAIDRVISFA